jgi:hypothetical protein
MFPNYFYLLNYLHSETLTESQIKMKDENMKGQNKAFSWSIQIRWYSKLQFRFSYSISGEGIISSFIIAFWGWC